MRPNDLTTTQIELMREIVAAGDLLLRGIATMNEIDLQVGQYRMTEAMNGRMGKEQVMS